MIEVVPSIFTSNITNFNQIFNVYKSFAKRIQIDISDSKFTPSPTVELSEINLPPDWQGAIDFHLLVSNPSVFLPLVIKLHPSLCILHAECKENLLPIFEQLSNAGIKTGVAILKSTYPGNVKPYLESADHALIFASSPDQQNEEINMLQLEKASIIKEIDSNIEIGWEGGVTLENIRTIAHNDINVINVGGALKESQNPAETYQLLVSETEKQGVNF